MYEYCINATRNFPGTSSNWQIYCERVGGSSWSGHLVKDRYATRKLHPIFSVRDKQSSVIFKIKMTPIRNILDKFQ